MAELGCASGLLPMCNKSQENHRLSQPCKNPKHEKAWSESRNQRREAQEPVNSWRRICWPDDMQQKAKKLKRTTGVQHRPLHFKDLKNTLRWLTPCTTRNRYELTCFVVKKTRFKAKWWRKREKWSGYWYGPGTEVLTNHVILFMLSPKSLFS